MERLMILLFFLATSNTLAQEQLSQQVENNSTYVVDVGAFDYAFAIPEEIPSGWITFRFNNKGNDTHVAFIGKKPDTLATESFLKDINNWQWPIGDPMGGPGFHSPGQKSETTIHLKPGDYYIACGAKTENGKIHSDLGMIRYFKVLEKPSGAPEPVADGVVALKKYQIDADLFKSAGEKTLKIKHEDYPMDLHLVKLEGKSSIKEAEEFFYDISDPTFTQFLGGVEEAETGRVSYLKVNVEPGRYALMSHEYSVWGMKQPFIVKDNYMVAQELPKIAKEDPAEFAVSLGNNNLNIIKSNDIQKGVKILKVQKTDTILHSLAIVRMKPGKTIEDIEAYWKEIDEYWKRYEETGEKSSYPVKPYKGHYFYPELSDVDQLRFQLTPGYYLAICPERDAEGVKHWNKGEKEYFSVGDNFR